MISHLSYKGAVCRQSVRWIYALGGIVLAGYVWHCLAVNYVVDDSFITFRYVKNFVHGGGLTYNIGERVEGYTNFLWVTCPLIMRPVDMLGLSHIDWRYDERQAIFRRANYSDFARC